ncbi:hypothetical protein RHOFW510R12_00095 [Rhodanobacter sp. FW510-R12]|uniref:hypothetical protein n=1 Tax=unclassified Rhodanobacter TaxID=2621553 RepID=UPI0007AA0977|nr:MULTISPECIES: hypothetical protein [unclassified Rhodanobacter]KZC15605.1 hypothetical protein RHOFW104R8_04150 [Rhodanobacter sp. FW104-R8]KZC28308.1 hypothetical protein RhoFW510T8_11650 [Rhodanobacter sp. FW510-T8]KZC32683.1 hypothetical protein RhoFW510R10_11170 [Rhodanobacter sp. FW510-R10]
MTASYLFLSTLAALGFYLACAHQRLWTGAHVRVRVLRIVAWVATVLAATAAIVALGPWAGVFASLTALMLVLVLLPYLDAWWSSQQGDHHVG